MSDATAPSTSFLSHTLYVLRRNPITLMAFSLLGLLVVCAIFGPSIVPYDPLSSEGDILQPPSAAHWFGTDQLGRDVFSRVIVAARLDLMISVGAVALSFVAVSILGSIAAGIITPCYARVGRAEVNIRRDAGFVQAAKLAGNSDLRVLALHIFPNALPPMMVQVSLNMGWAVLNAAGLSFIGLGVRPPTPEWGIMVAEGAGYIISGEWWLALFPGLALMLAVFTFNLLGDGLRDIVDPRQRR